MIPAFHKSIKINKNIENINIIKKDIVDFKHISKDLKFKEIPEEAIKNLITS